MREKLGEWSQVGRRPWYGGYHASRLLIHRWHPATTINEDVLLTTLKKRPTTNPRAEAEVGKAMTESDLPGYQHKGLLFLHASIHHDSQTGLQHFLNFFNHGSPTLGVKKNEAHAIK